LEKHLKGALWMPRSLLDRPRIARSAAQRLTEDPEQTEMVFEITEALAARQPERLLRRILPA
jgi:hypothetical protein